jgi:meso-butanediol dehydrogenase/(S,S)-butanediol dehydrogenase/diacetyl reductase
MPDELSRKVILLIGGANGIGYECASAYVREGAAVALLDREGEKAAEAAAKLGSDCMAIQADVGDGPAVEAAIHPVLARYGKVDAVHNNAGIASPSKPLHETTAQGWDELMRLNVKSVLRTTWFALDALATAKGSILNTASMVGLIGQDNHAAYAATSPTSPFFGQVKRTHSQTLEIEAHPECRRIGKVISSGILRRNLRAVSHSSCVR